VFRVRSKSRFLAYDFHDEIYDASREVWIPSNFNEENQNPQPLPAIIFVVVVKNLVFG